jgi:ribonuclease Y
MEAGILFGIIFAIVGAVIGFFISKVATSRILSDAKSKAKTLKEEANKELEFRKSKLELEVERERTRQRSDFERMTRAKRVELERLEKRLQDQRESIESRADLMRKREKEWITKERQIHTKEKAIEEKENQLTRLIRRENEKLERIAGMTQEEAKRILMENLISEAKAEALQKIKQIRDEAEHEAERQSREIIISSIQRCAAETTVESTVSVVTLPSDEIKGRIIGREGRNIRAFETASGVDVIVDDTPEAIILSGYDPIRREIARIAMEKLIMDGRIHPARIEEVLVKAEKEIESIFKETGEQVCFELGVHDLQPELTNLIGRLKYRTSYGQNVLQHIKEVSWISGFIASELDLDPRIARRCGLLHDIGKAVDRGQEGTHTQLGYEIAKKFGEKDPILNSILAHHEDVEVTSPYTIIIQAADAISGARPGARRETIENYIKRLQKLEELADSFPGVQKTYAIQAGREIRVIVEPIKVSDQESEILAAEISQKIELDMEYPGQIKVTVIRETRAIDYAR